MGLIESASEWYPTGTDVEHDGGVPNRSSILLSISCAWRMAVWYCLFSSSSSEEFKWVPNEAMACPTGVSKMENWDHNLEGWYHQHDLLWENGTRYFPDKVVGSREASVKDMVLRILQPHSLPLGSW